MSSSGFHLIWRREPSSRPPTVFELRAGEQCRSALEGRQRARKAAVNHVGEVPYLVGPKGGLTRVALGGTR